MPEPFPAPSRLIRHVAFSSANAEEAARWWSSAAQPSVLHPLSPELNATICSVALGDATLFWTEIRGAYRIETLTPGDTFSLTMLSGGSGSFAWPVPTQKPEKSGYTLYWLDPGVDVDYTVVNPAGITAKIGVRSIDRIRIKALPYARRLALSGLLPHATAEDLVRLLTFLVDEIDRLDFAPGQVPAQVMLVKDALVARSMVAISDALGPLQEVKQGDLETVIDCDRAISTVEGGPSSVADLAKVVPWSQRQIYRAFDRVCDCTPNDYIRRTLMIAARSRVRFSAGPVTSLAQIARQFGYRTPRLFERDYLLEFGERARGDFRRQSGAD